jgi:flagellar basal-body rod protein FlgF
MFYLAMAGLDATMQRTAAAANNLANRNTTAFKAQRPVFEALPVFGQGLPDRVAVTTLEDSADFRAGPIEQTGRSLDVAVKGAGWLAVQAPDGSIALTRNGALSISPLGVLQTSDGHPVLGRGFAPIVLPPLQKLTIGQDGTISGVPQGQNPNQVAALNRIMLTNPPVADLSRREDGLFVYAQGSPPPDAAVHLQSAALEGSNADTVGLMMNMIENSRLFEMQSEMVKTMLHASQGQNTPLSLT